MRVSKSFTIEKSIVSYVKKTRGNRSNSDRVNELLSEAIELEQELELELEAAEFFAAESAESRAEARTFQEASIRSIGKD